MEFSIKDFFSKCDQIRRNLRIWSYLQKKSLMEKFIFCIVEVVHDVILFHALCIQPIQKIGPEFFRTTLQSLEHLMRRLESIVKKYWQTFF